MSAPKLSPVARRIINEAFRLMRKYPHHYNQSAGARPALTKTPMYVDLDQCGTVGCIAGFIHSAAASLRVDHPVAPTGGVHTWNTARALLLELNDCSEAVIKRFYHFDLWPSEFKYAFNKAETKRQKTAVAIRRMRHWVKTGK